MTVPEIASEFVPPLQFVPLDEFAAASEPSAEPLLGTSDATALPAGGTLLLYGDAGTSKTTLTIDAVLHMAAGAPWCGLTVTRPLAVLVIENEGPRGPFREKLRRKVESWQGPPFAGRVHVLEEPWARFTFADEQHRDALAAFVVQRDVDVVVSGPLASLGAEGGGTPDDVSAFERLLADVRDRAERPIAFWIVHHENKAGDVSGAWQRLPDTLVHAKLEGRERTILHWRKARWSSALHGARWTLAWATEREGFDLVEQDEDTAAKRAAELADATAWIVRYVSEHRGVARSKVEEAYHKAHGGGRNLARRAIDEQLERLREPESERRADPVLATTTGERANGTYLIPFADAPSPLAATPSGEDGDEGCDPELGTLLATSPHPLRGRRGGGEEADGAPEELEWR